VVPLAAAAVLALLTWVVYMPAARRELEAARRLRERSGSG
jgi:hypothetical protein